MANDNIRILRDGLDDARQELCELTLKDHDPVEALECRNRAYAFWQARNEAVKTHSSAVLLTHKLRGEETWYVQVLWLDGSELHPVSFQTEGEALWWIRTKSKNWLNFQKRKIA